MIMNWNTYLTQEESRTMAKEINMEKMQDQIDQANSENEALGSQIEDLGKEAEAKVAELEATQGEVQRLRKLNEELTESVDRVKGEGGSEVDPDNLEYDTDLLALSVGIIRDITTNGPMRDDKEAQRRSATYVHQAKIMYQELIK